MTLSSHQRPHHGLSDDWLTPPDIIKALGPFDLDPCASVNQPWRTAAIQLTVEDGNLGASYLGSGLDFVWLNPPFSDVSTWLAAMAEHGNGIALVAARTETRWFRQYVWGPASAVMFLYGRPHFHHPVTGRRATQNCGTPICLAAYGRKAVHRLMFSGLVGALVNTWANYLPNEDVTDDD